MQVDNLGLTLFLAINKGGSFELLGRGTTIRVIGDISSKENYTEIFCCLDCLHADIIKIHEKGNGHTLMSCGSNSLIIGVDLLRTPTHEAAMLRKIAEHFFHIVFYEIGLEKVQRSLPSLLYKGSVTHPPHLPKKQCLWAGYRTYQSPCHDGSPGAR